MCIGFQRTDFFELPLLLKRIRFLFIWIFIQIRLIGMKNDPLNTYTLDISVLIYILVIIWFLLWICFCRLHWNKLNDFEQALIESSVKSFILLLNDTSFLLYSLHTMVYWYLNATFFDFYYYFFRIKWCSQHSD